MRIGWVVSPNNDLRNTILKIRQWILQSTAAIDERIGKEVLSPRCRQNVVNKTLANAKANIAALQDLVSRSKGRLECTIPKGGGTAFVKVLEKAGGDAVDDVKFCQDLVEGEGLLIAPASRCFLIGDQSVLKGHVRVHITAKPEVFKQGMEKLGKALGV